MEMFQGKLLTAGLNTAKGKVAIEGMTERIMQIKKSNVLLKELQTMDMLILNDKHLLLMEKKHVEYG